MNRQYERKQSFLFAAFKKYVRVTAICSMLAFAPALPGCNKSSIIADPLPPQGKNACCLLFVVHGLGDTPEKWPAELLSAIKTRLDNETRWDIVAYDWSAYSSKSDWLTASDSGLEVGRQVGQVLASSAYSYEHIHFFAHSVGSFVIHAAARAYIDTAGARARIHMTFTDPFTTHGVFGFTYGKKNFGIEADFAEMYLNTDDPVPSTNTPLYNTHNFDVTGNVNRNPEEPDAHWWPIDYYIMTVKNAGLPYGFQLSPMATGPGNKSNHADFHRGEKTVVP